MTEEEKQMHERRADGMSAFHEQLHEYATQSYCPEGTCKTCDDKRRRDKEDSESSERRAEYRRRVAAALKGER